MPHRRGKHEHGAETTGGFASRCGCDYWSDQWLVSVGAREAVMILPGGCGGTQP